MTAVVLTACVTGPKKDNFTVDIFGPAFPAGDIETQIDKTFPMTGLKKIAVEVSYFPYDDAVCLRYRSDFYNYLQFWSGPGREAFLKAFAQYNEDYAMRSLAMKNKKSKKTYGTIEGYLTWQMFSLTRRADANMDVELGYAFKENAPYYAVTQKLTTYVDKISRDNDANSQEITMYFTRAQAQELADFFDPDFLRGLIPPEMGGKRRTVETEVEADLYYEESLP